MCCLPVGVFGDGGGLGGMGRRRLWVWINLLESPEPLTFGIDYGHLGDPHGILRQWWARQEGCF